MKFISAAVALLVSAAVVKSLPVYPNDYETSTTDDWHNDYETSTSEDWHNAYETSTSETWNDYNPTTTSDDYYTTTYTPSPSAYPENYCEGFTIKSPSESDISWDENSEHEVVFDFGNSKIKEVEYVDVVKYENQEVVDQWATGPYTPSNPTTGSHSIHIPRGESGEYQFLVYAATEDHQHCTYLSIKFKVVSKGYEGDDSKYETTTTDYYETETETATYETETATYDYLPTSTESSSYDDQGFTPYSP